MVDTSHREHGQRGECFLKENWEGSLEEVRFQLCIKGFTKQNKRWTNQKGHSGW